MARIRTLKPELWQDEDVGQLDREARLLFVGLITQADDHGLLVGAARLLWAQIYPWDDFDPEALEKWLADLEGAGILLRYEHKGRPYILLNGWEAHQKISHKTPSKFPAPPKRSSRKKRGSGSQRKPSGENRSAAGEPQKPSSPIGSDQTGEDRNGSVSGSPRVASLAPSPQGGAS